MANLNFPLSGPVSQIINPWTGNQIGLFNINLGEAGNPTVEQKILNDVGSYGRQLGRIGDVLRILVDKVDKDKVTTHELKIIKTLLTQLDFIDYIKESNEKD